MSSIPGGSFRLTPGIQLIDAPGGGVMLQPDPLRALKVNPAAFTLLRQCQAGLRTDDHATIDASQLTFLDTLVQSGIVTWTPPVPEPYPMVSVVIPVFNRPDEIEACLRALQALDYPTDRYEIIVVDDASHDRTAETVRRFSGVRLIVQPVNRGASAARNRGVAMARGEIVAFLDSDCLITPGWLKELVPYFQDSRVALVGGFVDAAFEQTQLDRYEKACSALNMGPSPVMGRGPGSVFYVPTCNMLVRRAACQRVGGLDERLTVGEDVDLCWRLMAAGHHLHYIPRGSVRHRHRNRFLSAFLRRYDYGTSEALLYARFPGVAKQFPWQPAGVLTILAGIIGLAGANAWWVMAIAAILVVEAGIKRVQLHRRMGIGLRWIEILTASLKSHFKLAYYLAYYLVRYHLLPLVLAAFTMPSFIGLWGTILILPIVVDYRRKRPRLNLAVFAVYYLAEHLFYQWGAFAGCVRQRQFRLYGIVFRHTGFLPGAARRRKTAEKTPRTVRGRT